MATTYSRGGLSCSFSGHLSYVAADDGSLIVQAGPNGIRLESYSTTGGSAGATANLPGTNLADVYANQLSLPYTLYAKQQAVITSTSLGPSRPNYWSPDGRSVIDEALAIVVVDYPVGPGLFRPPALGVGDVAQFLRSIPIPLSQMNLAKLPSVINIDTLPVNWSSWGSAKPDFDYFERLFGSFNGELYDGWVTDTRTPDWQHPGYGTGLASLVSQALVFLCSTYPVEQKRKLAQRLVQWGLDYAGAFGDGRVNFNNGGHMQGRKALLILAGHLLGAEPLATPDNYLPNVFQENRAYYEANPAWWFGWKYGWSFHANETPFMQKHVTQWTMGDRQEAWGVKSYMGQCLGAQIGTALAMHLMGRGASMGAPFMGMIKQFMDGPPSAVDSDMTTVGISVPWGKDYSFVKGGGMCAAAWKAYYPA